MLLLQCTMQLDRKRALAPQLQYGYAKKAWQAHQVQQEAEAV